MPKGYMTSSEFLVAVKRQAAIPANQSTFTDQDILDLANAEMKIGLVPSILSVNEEFYVYPESVTLVANKSDYQIPYRAIGGRLRDASFVDNSGNLRPLSRISPDDKSLYQQSTVNTNNLVFFYLQGNSVVITPPISTLPSGSLLFTYYMRPNDLVTIDQASTIQSIATTSTTVTFTMDNIPKGFSTSILFDLMQTNPGHKTIDYDLTAVEVNSVNKTITFNLSDIDTTTVTVGDYVTFAGQCIIPQAPSDLHTVLVQRTVSRILEAQADTQGLNNSNTKVQEMESKTFPLIDNRTEGAPIKITNRYGLLRRGRSGRVWTR